MSCVQRQFKQELKLGVKTADKGPEVGGGGVVWRNVSADSQRKRELT